MSSRCDAGIGAGYSLVAVMLPNHCIMAPRHVATCLGIVMQWVRITAATKAEGRRGMGDGRECPVD